MDLAYCKDRLSDTGVLFEKGLTPQELASIERDYGFIFPCDLREFLAYALPVSSRWVDWRRASSSDIKARLDWPFQGMCFDIQHSAFWLDSWGEKPQALGQAFNVARAAINAAPRLIPVYSHRYMPDRPSSSGNPVFSVYQTDIIYYGADLFDYLCNEFCDQFGRAEHKIGSNIRDIEFWSQL